MCMPAALPPPPPPWQVEYYGALTPLKQLASIAVPDASTLMISPFDKASLKEIEKAINSSDIGINPNNDGQHIRLNIPAMTQVGGGYIQTVCTYTYAVCVVCSAPAVERCRGSMCIV